MKRRVFWGAAAGTGALAIGHSSAEAVTAKSSTAPLITEIGGMSLDAIYKELHTELFDIFLPLMERAVIDNEYGGFMCQAHPDETRVNTDKRTWYQGRGVWVYSYLYQNFGRNPRHLEIARKGVEFILKTMPPKDTFWAEWYTREGKPMGEPDKVLYSDLFQAEGLQEFAAASGEEKYFALAREILFKMMDIYDHRPGYGAMPQRGESDALPGSRQFGHWMLIMRLTTQMLAKHPDPEVESVAGRCIDMMMNYHWNPECGLFNEYLNTDLSRIRGGYGDFTAGHGQEAMWMAMERALFKKDRKLFDTCAERLRRHIEVFWDDVYGGQFIACRNIEKNIWDTTKPLWLHDETCIGTMMVIEHTNADWARHWYAQCYKYIREKLDNRNYGCVGWEVFPDRKATFNPKYDRIENFHQPKHCMLDMQAIDRIRKRGGKISGVFV